jgi:hypothetical protein
MAHAIGVVTTHVWFGRQHAPIGGGQLAAPHSVPSPRYVPWCETHHASVVIWHPPLGRQHAPLAPAGHDVPAHDVPLPP